MEFSSSAIKNSLTICICTSGRPLELKECLESIATGTMLPNGVIVSDDSHDAMMIKQIQEVCSQYPFVRYVEGPKRGLCPNRNRVIEQATTTHVSLIDDDGVVGHDFVQFAMLAIEELPAAIISGDVLESGEVLTPPANPTRWGHFGAAVNSGELLQTVNLNCNIFPLAAFAHATFDENLVYGYEDMDLCSRLIQAGWGIQHRPELVNKHFPPTRDGSRRWLAERERFVVLFRRRSMESFGRFCLIAWVPFAGLHALIAYTRRGLGSWILQLPLWLIRGVWLALKRPSPENLLVEVPVKTLGVKVEEARNE